MDHNRRRSKNQKHSRLAKLPLYISATIFYQQIHVKKKMAEQTGVALARESGASLSSQKVKYSLFQYGNAVDLQNVPHKELLRIIKKFDPDNIDGEIGLLNSGMTEEGRVKQFDMQKSWLQNTERRMLMHSSNWLKKSKKMLNSVLIFSKSILSMMVLNNKLKI